MPAALSAPTGQRYYTPWQITVAAILGGPLAGGYLASRDHAAFGAQGRARATLAVSALLLCGLLYVGHRLPPGATGTPIAVGVAFGYRWYARVSFDGEIARRGAAGWVAYSWWHAIGISLVVMAAMFLLIFVALLASGWQGLPSA